MADSHIRHLRPSLCLAVANILLYCIAIVNFYMLISFIKYTLISHLRQSLTHMLMIIIAK